MCRFIILLLLLCNNGKSTRSHCCIEPRMHERYVKEHDHHRHCHEKDTERKMSEWKEERESCTCTTCENTSDSVCADATDSRTIFLNTSAVNCQK